MTTKLLALLLALLLTGCAPKEDTKPAQTPPAASEEASAPADARLPTEFPRPRLQLPMRPLTA